MKLTIAQLKHWLHEDIDLTTKLLCVLAHAEPGVSVQQIRDLAANAGLRIPHRTNISSLLGRSGGRAIRGGVGWELAERGVQYLTEVGVLKAASERPSAKAADALVTHLSAIADKETKEYLLEAVDCLRAGSRRAAIVMSWIAAIYILQRHVFQHHLAAFNAEMARVEKAWKDIKVLEDFERIKERVFLDRAAHISIISSNVKKELVECLDRRNTYGHPSSARIGEHAAAHHVETLILNVFQRYV